jgi:transcription-repair coupling factor (superfamily II helicase)
MGLQIEQLSRLVTPAKAKQIKEDLRNGKVNIIIGTHALLSQDIKFTHLGLIIVDEEQHFGVKQKEKLKELQKGVHVLTLTATPIPRTLQMALTGVRDMSIIATPPIDRLAVRTFVTPYDPLIIKEAVHRELHRGGQIFYVCPRVKDLPEILQKLEMIEPSLQIGVAHGQMPPRKLEDVMDDFVDRKYNVLLATNIIESGIDLPSVNTIFIHRSDLFGLSQLYQLRGRIGRGKIRGYAYLTLPPHQILSTAAQKRLEVMQALDILGAGFQIASHDMDIRGAGNLLGQEQSGHIREVGVELYQQMLKEAVEHTKRVQDETQTDVEEETWSPQINFGIPVLIPDTYVADLSVRLELYRRLARLTEPEELYDFENELIDRFGPMPPEVDNLLRIMRLKQLCLRTYVERLDVGERGIVFSFRNNVFPHAERLIDYIQKQPNKAYIRPDQKVVFSQTWQDSSEQYNLIKRILEDIAEFA